MSLNKRTKHARYKVSQHKHAHHEHLETHQSLILSSIATIIMPYEKYNTRINSIPKTFEYVIQTHMQIDIL